MQSVALGRSHRSSDEKDCRRRAKKISSQAGTNRSWAILRESPEGKSGMAWNVNAPAAWKLAAMRRTSSFGQTLGDSRKRLDAPCHRSPKRRCRRRHPSGWRPSCCRCSYLPTQALRGLCRLCSRAKRISAFFGTTSQPSMLKFKSLRNGRR